MPDGSLPYPGETASADQILRLAAEYRAAAHALRPLGRRGHPLSRAPFRLTAIHAIELYLNALLLHTGHDPAEIRGLRHDLAARAERALAGGLTLRQRTANHLSAMTGAREYLVTRYGPEMTVETSQINRLSATLDEVADKVVAAMKTVDTSPAG